MFEVLILHFFSFLVRMFFVCFVQVVYKLFLVRMFFVCWNWLILFFQLKHGEQTEFKNKDGEVVKAKAHVVDLGQGKKTVKLMAVDENGNVTAEIISEKTVFEDPEAVHEVPEDNQVIDVVIQDTDSNGNTIDKVVKGQVVEVDLGNGTKSFNVMRLGADGEVTDETIAADLPSMELVRCELKNFHSNKCITSEFQVVSQSRSAEFWHADRCQYKFNHLNIMSPHVIL